MQEKTKIINIVFYTGLAALLSLLFLGVKNFSQDELDTLYIIKDVPTLFYAGYNFEGNMWLYYIASYFWQFLGHSEATFRLLPVIFNAATIPFIYLLVKNLSNQKTAQIVTLLLAIHVFMVTNAQFARSYAMLLFFVTVSAYFFSKYILNGSKKHLYVVAFLNTLAVYCHIYALFFIAAQFLSAFLLPKPHEQGRKSIWKEMLLPFIATGVLLLPLFLAPSMHDQVGWLYRPGIVNLMGGFFVLSGDFFPIVILYLILFSVFIFRLWKKRVWTGWRASVEMWRYGFMLIWLVFPIVSSFTFSILVKPIYQSTYLSICLIPFAFFVALALQSIKRVWLQNTLLAVIILLSFVRLYGWYTESVSLGPMIVRNYNEDWKKTAVFLSTHMNPEDAVLFSPPTGRHRVGFYINQENLSPLPHEVILQLMFLEAGKRSYVVDTNAISAMPDSYSHVWFVRKHVIDKKTDEANFVITSFLTKHYKNKKLVAKLRDIEIFEYIR